MAKKLICAVTIALLAIAPSANASSSVVVFAASSLTDSYTHLGKIFEKQHPGVKINFSFQASNVLWSQIKSGAPAEIFVSAEPFVGGSDYLKNRIVMAVSKNSNAKKIADLNSLRWIQCAHEVPCGQVADAALSGEGVTSKPLSLEPKVSSAAAKLLAGEVDAALIYRSDVVTNNSKLRAIEFSNKDAATTTYQIALLKRSVWANTFLSFLKSRATIKYLKSKGFDSK